MKKLLSLVLTLCLVWVSTVALAADQPFEKGVSYGETFKGEYGAVPSMLNFGGTARLRPGESFDTAKKETIKKIRGAELLSNLSSNTYYCYAKWQFGKAIASYDIDAMLVMTSPGGEYYATYDSWRIEDTKAKTICSWYFDVTDCLQRYADEHNNTFEKGEYVFSLFLNHLTFRTVRLKVN